MADEYVASVIDYAETHFACEQGQLRAYHQLVTGEKHYYVTLGFSARGWFDGRERVERALRDLLREVYASLPPRMTMPIEPDPKLYWRLRPKIELHWRTWTIRTRLAIPGVDWSRFPTKPEGLPAGVIHG